jgi:hypothetical protein
MFRLVLIVKVLGCYAGTLPGSAAVASFAPRRRGISLIAIVFQKGIQRYRRERTRSGRTGTVPSVSV